MHVAETRSTARGGVLDATQRIPREAMLYAYTRNVAHALSQLNEIGSLAPGKRADPALIDRDVLTAPVAELEDAQVVWTMFGGKIVSGEAPGGWPSTPQTTGVNQTLLRNDGAPVPLSIA